MIRQFPLFSKLTINHKSEATKLVANFEPFSDFNFTSLFCWDTNGSVEISILKDNLVIKLPDYLTNRPVYSILGANKIDESFIDLLQRVKSVQLVPEPVIKKVKNVDSFKILEDRDNFDYIYRLDLLAGLPGVNLKKKRNKANGFQKAFKGQSIGVISTVLTPQKISDIDRVFVEWSKSLNKNTEEIRAEHKALSRLVKHSDFLGVQLTEVTVGGRLVAFSINEKVSSIYALCHFEKALPDYNGKNIYTYLSQEVSKELIKLGCTFVNWEQDLGLPGLRKSKLSYDPSKFLRKYTITLR